MKRDEPDERVPWVTLLETRRGFRLIVRGSTVAGETPYRQALSIFLNESGGPRQFPIY